MINPFAGRLTPVLLLSIFALVSAPAHAQDDKPVDIEGSKDHLALKRYPGGVIVEFAEKEFETFPFPLGDTAEGVKTKTVEGKLYFAVLDYPAKVSCTQIRRNYENAFKAAGLALHHGVNSPWERGWSGDSLGWISAEGRARQGGMELFMLVSCGELNGAGSPPNGVIFVLERQLMEQKIEIDASAMEDELVKTGRIALYGLQFATGKADLTPDSEKTLGEIARLMAKQQDWSLRIDGHTDNVGAAKSNLALSKKRAAAVKEHLVAKLKVAAARLSTDGFGDSKPLAPNTNEEGRAKNRRVELAKR